MRFIGRHLAGFAVRRQQRSEAIGRVFAAPPECARPRAQQAPAWPACWKVPGPDCLRTLLRPGMGNATRIWKVVWGGQSSSSHGIAGRLRPSPSPRPSPLGRGGLALRLPNIPETLGLRTRCRRFSLSPRERAGVRGNEGIERSLPTQIPPARFRPSPKILVALPIPGRSRLRLAQHARKSQKPLPSTVAAPGDGRTPVQAGLDAGGTRKMCPKQQPSPVLDSHRAVAAITIFLTSRS